MGDSGNVQLQSMKRYTLDRLSINGTGSTPEIRINGASNRAPNGYEDLVLTNGHREHLYSNTEMPPIQPQKEEMPPPVPSNPPRVQQQQSRGNSRPSSGRSHPKFIPEHDIDIPVDGSLAAYSVDDMSTFLRYMGVEERIVNHVHKKGLDGAKFARLKDSDLEGLGMKNPIICHFRDRSIKERSPTKKKVFMML